MNFLKRLFSAKPKTYAERRLELVLMIAEVEAEVACRERVTKGTMEFFRHTGALAGYLARTREALRQLDLAYAPDVPKETK